MIGTLKANDVYMDLLETLPDDEKLDLISKLVKSMKKAVAVNKKPKDIFARFSSDWVGIWAQKITPICFVVKM